MLRCVLRYDTKLSPRGAQGTLPFKGPIPMDQERDTFIYREKREEIASRSHPDFLINTQTPYPHQFTTHYFIVLRLGAQEQHGAAGSLLWVSQG